MSRCYCCNVILTPYESTIRSARTSEFMDMCSKCLQDVISDIETTDRLDLREEAGTVVANYEDYEDTDYEE